MIEHAPINLITAEAVEAKRLVYINSSGLAAYATASIRPFGVTQNAAASGGVVSVFPLSGAGVLDISASGAAAVGSVVYSAASGQISTTSSGIAVGTVTKAGFAANDEASVAINAAPAVVLYYNVTQAAGLTLTALDSGCIVTNVGASGAATVTLPTDPPYGTFFRFFVSAAQELRVLPGAGNKIVGLGALAPSDAEYVTANANGEHLNLIANSSGDWQCVGYSGTWTEQTP